MAKCIPETRSDSFHSTDSQNCRLWMRVGSTRREVLGKTYPPEQGFSSIWDVRPERDQGPGGAAGAQQAEGPTKAFFMAFFFSFI